ncbi:MAG TPA: hypothetical protein VMU50_23385 [Polyangia bacterium]|nr:hypothetical protein [Polyangia bacterium]
MDLFATRQAQYQSRLGAVSTLMEAGRPHDALERMRALCKADPELAVAHNDLAVVAFAAGRLAEAHEAIARAARLCHEDPALAADIRHNQEAIEAALRAADPKVAYEASVAVVNRLVARDELALAIAEVEKFLAAHPALGEAWNDLAVLQHASHRLEPAVIASGIACEIEAGNPDFRRTRTAILLDAGRLDEAGKTIVPVLMENAADVEALLLAGDIAVAAGHPADARPFYRHALQIDPACGRAALELASLPVDESGAAAGPAHTLVLCLGDSGAAALDQTLRSFARHCVDAGDVDVKVLYRAANPAEQRLCQAVALEHPFATLIAEGELARQLPALLAPHRHVLLVGDGVVFVRDFRLTDATRALDAEPRALGCALALGENTVMTARGRRAQRVPALTRFSHGLYRFAWSGADQDFGRPLGATAGLYRADEIRRLLPALAFTDGGAPALDAALAGASGRFAAARPTMLCFDRAVATPGDAERAQTAPAPVRIPALSHALPLAV